MTKAIAKKSNKRSLVWAGGQELMGAPQATRDKSLEQVKRERGVLEMIATVLNVTIFGVDMLGNKPYLNNLGRKDKMFQYDKRAMFDYDWLKVAEDDTQKAICRARIVQFSHDDKGQLNSVVLTPWIIGECSDATMSMKTLHGYQNHIAQTRAENRAFQYLYGLRMHHEMLENIAKMKSGVTKEEVALIANAISVPAEDVQPTATKRFDSVKEQTKSVQASEILKIISATDAKTGRARLEDLKARIMNGTKSDYTPEEKTRMVDLIDLKLAV